MAYRESTYVIAENGGTIELQSCEACGAEVRETAVEAHDRWHSVLELVLPRHCRECGCTDDDCSNCVERRGYPCAWIDPLNVVANLCTACVP